MSPSVVCTICLEDVRAFEHQPRILPCCWVQGCGAVFHAECITEYIAHRADLSCPTCRYISSSGPYDLECTLGLALNMTEAVAPPKDTLCLTATAQERCIRKLVDEAKTMREFIEEIQSCLCSKQKGLAEALLTVQNKDRQIADLIAARSVQAQKQQRSRSPRRRACADDVSAASCCSA